MTLDVTKGNVVDFHHLLPVIDMDKPFRFVVDNWDSDAVTKLTFKDFRPNTSRLNPLEDRPVKFSDPIKMEGKSTREWVIEKDDLPNETEPIRLKPPHPDIDRRLIDYTLTMTVNGTDVGVDPPLDERRPPG
ncbi:MAG: hypothetical protein OES47_10780 [Acidobacteriota bacterium]|nr:hypothetical protein [Acidobacteriota bacterium]